MRTGLSLALTRYNGMLAALGPNARMSVTIIRVINLFHKAHLLAGLHFSAAISMRIMRAVSELGDNIS